MARRTAKQRAATRKLVAFNRRRKSRPKRKAPKRRRRASPKRQPQRRRKAAKKKKANKRKAPKKDMVFGKKIPIIGSPVVRKAATGIGIATIGVTILSLVAPGIAANPIVRPALAFLGGGVPGVVASIFLQGGASLGNLFGGGGNGGGGGGGAA